jgi:hypothetical protein
VARQKQEEVSDCKLINRDALLENIFCKIKAGLLYFNEFFLSNKFSSLKDINNSNEEFLNEN